MRCDSRAGAGPFALPVPQWLFRDPGGQPKRRPAAPAVAARYAFDAGRSHLCDRSGATHGMRPHLTRTQLATIFNGINLIVTLLVILQLWLLTATMNAWLGGDSSVVWPAALASLGCFLVSLGLLRRVFLLERPGD